MENSWKHMNTVLWSAAVMESYGECSSGFLHIQLIILKSKSSLTCSTKTDTWLRVLLAGIKFLGQCPCPRCLVKKEDIYKMGMVLDMNRRVTRERTDNLRWQQCVDEARTLIFELGVPVDGSRVKAILNEESYVPIRVSIPYQFSIRF